MIGSTAICLLFAAAVMAGWYLWFRRVNRRKATQVLEWIEGALSGQGHVLGIRWISPSRCRIPIRLPSGFRRASIFVELLPRELPFSWFYQSLRRRRDQLTFEADLETPPRFNLQVFNHRWSGRTRKKLNPHSESWSFDQCDPFVITNRTDWQADITAMMRGLLASRDHDLLGVRFRRCSPHFSASMRLETVVPRNGQCSVFETLRELGTDASAARF